MTLCETRRYLKHSRSQFKILQLDVIDSSFSSPHHLHIHLLHHQYSHTNSLTTSLPCSIQGASDPPWGPWSIFCNLSPERAIKICLKSNLQITGAAATTRRCLNPHYLLSIR